MQSIKSLFLNIAVASLALCGAVQAAPVTFFGEDTGLGEATRLAAHPNADAARTSFLSNLVGVGTENFEGFADNQPAPLALVFPGAGTATLMGTGFVETVPTGTNGFGRYPISGDKYFDTNSTFRIEFSQPIAAFGFYGIDIGDFSGQVTLNLLNGSSTMLTIPNAINGPGGSVLYFGFIDTAQQYTAIQFGSTVAGSDSFGFDDMTLGSLGQVNPNPVPEPGTLGLLAAGVLGLLRRRRVQG